MEQDRLHELFAGFDPDLTSDNLFMSRLADNLEAVELVKKRIADVHRKNRLAIIVAAVTGFVFGVTLAVLYPWICAHISAITSAANTPGSYATYLILTAICACGFTMTYAAYDITLAATSKYGI